MRTSDDTPPSPPVKRARAAAQSAAALREHSYAHGCRRLDAHYEIVEEIANGSFGTVYKGRSLESGNVVAIKLLNRYPQFDAEGILSSTIREMTTLMAVSHPNLVCAHEICVNEAGAIYAILEYAEHELGMLLRINPTQRQLTFTSSQRKTLLKQLLEAVDYLHRVQGLMHRDLKPGNILYTHEGLIKICDFGCTRPPPLDTGLTTETYHVGTLWYEAPECLLALSGSVAPPMDMWSVGCIALEILLGCRPLFHGCDSHIDVLRRAVYLFGVPNYLEEKPAGWRDDDWQEILSWRMHETDSIDVYFKDLCATEVEQSWLTPMCKDLLTKLLAIDPKKRISAELALAHPYFREKPLPQKQAYMPKLAATNTRRRPPKP